MQPWKISAGLTTAGAGLALLLLGSRLEYLAPLWQVILSDCGVTIAAHPVLALGLSRASSTGRRGEGDPELAEALHRDAEGEWD